MDIWLNTRLDPDHCKSKQIIFISLSFKETGMGPL